MEDSLLILLQVLKYFGIIIGAVFGIFGLTRDFKGVDGKLNKSGKKALFIIAASGVVSVSAQTLEYAIELKKAEDENIVTSSLLKGSKEALKQNSLILEEINRNLFPLKDFKFSYTLWFPLRSELAQDYKKR
ncbi:unnamed protein product, partial [Ectocarpus sp. 13 AM-2016]